jgi:murein DD-endopeptidase MepM/ murein hydrolase activator NlpD
MKWFYAGAGTCRGPYLSSAQGNGTFIWPSYNHNTSMGNQYGAYHHAIDISASTGDPIFATDGGVVVFAGLSDWGYGNLVVIDHGNGWQSVYAHLSTVLTSCGADVMQWTQIGNAGSTGNSTGPHLHFELTYNGVYVNPLGYLP